MTAVIISSHNLLMGTAGFQKWIRGGGVYTSVQEMIIYLTDIGSN